MHLLRTSLLTVVLEELYHLMREALEVLPLRPPAPLPVLAFEMKFLSTLGFEPDLGRSTLSEASRSAARALNEKSWADIIFLDEPHMVLVELSRFLQMAIGISLERVPRQRERALRRR